MHGKVTVWYMTEEERLAYIEKHPIVPTAKPKRAEFSHEGDIVARKNAVKTNNKKPKIMDKFDKEEIRRRFLDGEKLEDIAADIGVSESTLYLFVRKQRLESPDLWSFIKTRGKVNKSKKNPCYDTSY